MNERILTYPDPALSVKGRDVDPDSDAGLRALVETMTRIMLEAPGVGLAATQLSVAKRVIVCRFEEDDEPIALLNPRIQAASEETGSFEEGCLSVPGVVVPIERALGITCHADDLDGRDVVLELDEFAARVVQHEIDHLDGVVILDRASQEERKAALKRYREVTL